MSLQRLDTWRADSLVMSFTIAETPLDGGGDAGERQWVVAAVAGAAFLDVAPDLAGPDALGGYTARWTPAPRNELFGIGFGDPSSGVYTAAEVIAAWRLTQSSLAAAQGWHYARPNFGEPRVEAGTEETGSLLEHAGDVAGGTVGNAIAAALKPLVPLLLITVVVVLVAIKGTGAKVQAGSVGIR